MGASLASDDSWIALAPALVDGPKGSRMARCISSYLLTGI